MNKLRFSLLIIFIFFNCSNVLGQEKINAKDAYKFIGEYKTVCGYVVSTKYASESKGKPTFLNLNKKYPDQDFTAVIWITNRNKFGFKPEVYYLDKNICVTGRISSYRDKPQIEVKDTGQIKLREH